MDITCGRRARLLWGGGKKKPHRKPGLGGATDDGRRKVRSLQASLCRRGGKGKEEEGDGQVRCPPDVEGNGVPGGKT